MWAIRKNSGFTIVELLIVIVVIGILAAIVIVAYTGITANANRSAIVSEMKQWEKLFSLYKVQYGSYPQPAAAPLTDGGPGTSALSFYCLGTGFPQVSGTRYCYATDNAPCAVEESRNATLLTELAKVGAPPTNSKKYIYGNVVGPMMRWYSANDIRIIGVFANGTDCSALNMTAGNSSSSRQECYIRMT